LLLIFKGSASVKKVRVVRRAGSTRQKKKVIKKITDLSPQSKQTGGQAEEESSSENLPEVVGKEEDKSEVDHELASNDFDASNLQETGEVHGEDAAVVVDCDLDRKVTSDESQLDGGEVSSQEPPETPSDQSVKDVSFQLEQELSKSSVVDDQSEPLLPSSSDQTMVDVVTESSPVCDVAIPTVTPIDSEPTEAEKPKNAGHVTNDLKIRETLDSEEISGKSQWVSTFSPSAFTV